MTILALVATKHTQGQRKNDFFCANENELLSPSGSECDGEPIDGRCGCRRSFVGLDSLRATTTALVHPVKMTREEYEEAFYQSYHKSWGFDREETNRMALDALQIAAHFPVGTVVERRGSTIRERRSW